MLLSFLFSFCSFTYQFLLVGQVALHSGLITESHALILAFFLAGMGVGAAHSDKIAASEAGDRLLQNELLLIVLMPVGFFAIQFSTVLIQKDGLSMYWLVILGQAVSAGVGYLTGRELPLLLKMHEKVAASKLISSNYFGALLSAIFTTHPLIISSGAVFILSSAILVTIFATLSLVKKQDLQKTTVFIVLAFCLLLGNLALETPLKKLFYFYKKQTEYAASLIDAYAKADRSVVVQSFSSPYQEIDIVWQNQIAIPESKQSHSVARKLRTSLYLDRARQLTSDSEKVYHELMAFVPIAAKEFVPQRVLILGGGDGVLAATLLEKYPQTQIKLIELDEMVLQLSESFQFIRRMNADVLKGNRLDLVIDDAFSYVRRNHNKEIYDAIYLDFPFPRSDDHLRLYSVEFYRMILRMLSPNGFMTLDFPFGSDKKKDQAILATLHQAGAQTVFAYGRIATFIMAGKTADFKSDAETLIKQLSTVSRPYFAIRSVTRRGEFQTEMPSNSIFRPNWNLRR